MKNNLFTTLENALLTRAPQLAAVLRPGLAETEIRSILSRAKIRGNVDALVALFSWKNGADMAKAEESFFPESIYQFLSLEAAVDLYVHTQRAASALIAFGSPVVFPHDPRRYFPVFSDGVTASLAIDLNPGMNNRVMEIEFESEEPYREICESFEGFIAEATKAIQKGEPLSFLP